MQNLALSSQFSNSGRRGNSSSNSFQSIVMNGVLPPSDDGRVEAIQLFDPKTKKYKQYTFREDSPLSPGGFMEWSFQPHDVYDFDSGGGGGSDTGTGKGGGGVPGNDVAYGGNGYIIPTITNEYYGPETWSEQERRRRESDSNLIESLDDYFTVGGLYTPIIVSAAQNGLIQYLIALGASVHDNSKSFQLLELMIEEVLIHSIDVIKESVSSLVKNPNRKNGDSIKKRLHIDNAFPPIKIKHPYTGEELVVDTVDIVFEAKYDNGKLFVTIWANLISNGKVVSYIRIAQYVID